MVRDCLLLLPFDLSHLSRVVIVRSRAIVVDDVRVELVGNGLCYEPAGVTFTTPLNTPRIRPSTHSCYMMGSPRATPHPPNRGRGRLPLDFKRLHGPIFSSSWYNGEMYLPESPFNQQPSGRSQLDPWVVCSKDYATCGYRVPADPGRAQLGRETALYSDWLV